MVTLSYCCMRVLGYTHLIWLNTKMTTVEPEQQENIIDSPYIESTTVLPADWHFQLPKCIWMKEVLPIPYFWFSHLGRKYWLRHVHAWYNTCDVHVLTLQASPHSTGLPMKTALAMALSTSVPRLTPPSKYTSILSPTTFTTLGSASIYKATIAMWK